ncbi:small-subunit processome [Tricholoma matsutake]|nr:small-subunit processome [Tricholoma matsutake 945]
MTSLRNSIHRRNHKERSQLAHRSKLGVLEKHADYVKRAQDYHSKQNRLTRLKQKAAERNKDEFYFSMRNERTKDGVHIKDRGNTALPTDIVKVLKTQDENYIRTMRAAGLKKIDKLKSRLTSLADLVKPHGIRDSVDDDLNHEEFQLLSEAGIICSSKTKKGGRKPNHIVFVDSDEGGMLPSIKTRRLTNPPQSLVQKYLPPDDHSLTEAAHNMVEVDETDLGWKPTEKGKKSIQRVAHASAVGHEDNDNVKPEQGDKRRLLTELAARLARDKQLRYTERELEMQRLMMGKGGRKKLRGAEKVEGDSQDEDEDVIDARKGKVGVQRSKVDEKMYRPRVYKWRLERKR